jgi:hypothetical protein
MDTKILKIIFLSLNWDGYIFKKKIYKLLRLKIYKIWFLKRDETLSKFFFYILLWKIN